MKFTLFIIINSSLTLLSCQTRRDIQRDFKISTLTTQMKDRQTLQSNITSRIQTLEEEQNKINGKIEESNYKATENAQKMEEKLLLLQAKADATSKELTGLKNKIAQQDKYLKEVLSTLNSFSGKKSKSKSRSKSKSKSSPYQTAMSNYKKKRYDTAQRQLANLLNTKLKSYQKARVFHNLGMIAFMKKNYKDSIIYFSRLFNQYPKSSYNKAGLLYTAKSYIRQKKKESAKQLLKELSKRFPKTKEAKQAKGLLKTL